MHNTLMNAFIYFLLSLPSVLAVTRSPGCGKTLSLSIKTGGPGSSNHLTLTSNGIKRTYLLQLPAAYSPDKPHGLIFSFHGRAESGAYQEKLSRFSESGVNAHMLGVYPEGVGKQWQGDPEAKTDDVKFTLDLLEKISGELCVDLERVYASGKSNGGGFAANVLPCDPLAPTKIAAFAGFAGAYYQNFTGTCDAAKVPIVCNSGRTPIPILEIHGSADPIIAYNGGARRNGCLPSIPHFVTEWARRDGLGTRNESMVLEGGKVVRYEFGSGEEKGVVTHYWVEGMGHVWPSVRANGDGCCEVLEGSVVAMDFFNRWTLKGLASSSSSAPSSKATAASSPSSKSTAPASSMTPPISHSTAETKTAQTSKTPIPSSTSSTPPICPSANGTTYTTPSNTNFQILCGYDTTVAYYGNPIYNLHSFGKCISACEEDEKCGHVVYKGVCYLKRGVRGLKRGVGEGMRVAIRVD